MIIVLMGVSGSGKTRIGRLLGEDLGWPFYDGDEFHPAANIEKMRQGVPLTDADRVPWLETLQKLILHHLQTRTSAVLACSALKQMYREMLFVDEKDVQFIYLKGEFELIQKRMERRRHFMKTDMLASQFETLEEPEGVLVVDIAKPPDRIVDEIKSELGLTGETHDPTA